MNTECLEMNFGASPTSPTTSTLSLSCLDIAGILRPAIISRTSLGMIFLARGQISSSKKFNACRLGSDAKFARKITSRLTDLFLAQASRSH